MKQNKESSLTTLANQYSSLDLARFSRESINWLQENVRKLRTARSISNGVIQEPGRPVVKVKKGELFFFKYSPKYADVLPYYDEFPLVLILDEYTEKGHKGFLGLNLHYLPVKARAVFMDQLLQKGVFETSTGPEKHGGRYNMAGDIRKIQISYEILKSVKRFKLFEPCLKRYLSSTEYLKSPLLRIAPHEWETALFLPVEQFKKARQSTVQAESMQSVRDNMNKEAER